MSDLEENVGDSEPPPCEDIEAILPEDETHLKDPENKLLKLPLSRIKKIMKMDPDVTIASQEAVFLITKATELMLDSLAREAYKYTAQEKKKTVLKKHLDSAIDNIDALAFLEGTLD